MRFSFTTTCVLSFFLLVTTAAAISVPREGHHRNSYDDVVELQAREKKAPQPHHPLAYGKSAEKKPPIIPKEKRKADHERQQADAQKKRDAIHLRRKANLEKYKQLPQGNLKEDPVKSKEQALLAKKKVQAKAESTQLEAKKRLSQRKAAGKMKFDTTREKYEATDHLPDRKAIFSTPGGQEFTGADARRAVFNNHHFTEKPTNSKPAEFRNAAGSPTNPQRVIENMKGTGTEFPINKHKYGYQGRPQQVKVKGQTPRLENPGPARAIVQEDKKSQRYAFKGVISHDEGKRGKGASAGEHAHHQIIPKPEARDDNNGEAMRNLFG